MRLLIATIVLLAFGCSSLRHDSRESGPGDGCREIAKFRRRDADAPKYVVLREANFERLYEIYRIESANTRLLLRKLKERHADATAMANDVDGFMEGEFKKLDRLRADFNDLKKASEELKTRVIEFEYQNGTEREWGFMLLKDGQIERRDVWGH